jgi:lipopolysaccharide export system protein LptA
MIRMKLLTAGRLAAMAVFLSIAAALAVYLIIRSKPSEAGPAPPKLQGRVVAAFNNTRYAHEVEGQIRFILTAGVERTYEDGTHELEQVKLESRGAKGDRNDVISADRAKVSDPADLTKLDAEFLSNVVLRTSDGLLVKTNYLHYSHAENLVETPELVTFERSDLSGKTTGLRIEADRERVHLLNDVDILLKSDGTGTDPGTNAGNASAARRETPAERAERKARKKARKAARRKRLTARKTGAAGKKSGASLSADLLSPDSPTRLKGQTAVLDRQQGHVTFTGNVTVTQAANEMRADRMVGFIAEPRRLERVEARGSCRLTQSKKLEITSSDMDFFFAETKHLSRAVAMGDVYARSLGNEPLREARGKSAEAIFTEGQSGGAIDSLTVHGEAKLRWTPNPPADQKTNPEVRELTAGVVVMQFLDDGQNFESAEASGNAVMTLVPIRSEPKADRKTIRAPRMNAVFYDDGTGLKSFQAIGGVKVEIEPMVKDQRSPRTTTSRTLDAEFEAGTQEVKRIVQEGEFRFNEADRNGTADRAIYEMPAETLYLRGKRPMVWDTNGRSQADELDYHRSTEEVHGRGDVRTTYYSRETTNNAAPFGDSKSPVFVTSDRVDVSNRDGVAVYLGNARAWQDDNFIKADRIELYRADKRMIAIGNVESALYSVEQKDGESEQGEVVPGFATAGRMTYSDLQRLVSYSESVKARHGTDRLEAEHVDVFLKKEINEVDRLMAQGKVVLLQPGRKGTGDKFAYTSEDGRAVLEGKVARVEESEGGVTMGSQLTFYSRDDKVFVDNRQGTGRVRSTYRLTKGKGSKSR